MAYNIFVGVVFYNCPMSAQDRVETVILIASDWTDAEDKTSAYALAYAAKTNLAYQDFKIFVQAQHVNRVENCLNFVKREASGELCELPAGPQPTNSKTPNLGRAKIEVKIRGKSFYL